MRDALLVACTVAALLGFAANSLLTRLALDSRAIDAPAFMLVRFASGAVTLAAIAGWRASSAAGSWVSALALAVYAIAFTYAYLRIGAGPGALLLFGSVQATMIGWGVWRGERPGPQEWLGLALALAGLMALTAPGLSAYDATGSSLMIAAGAAWGTYSLRGRGGTSPLASTAGNFVRAVPLLLPIVVAAYGEVFVTPRGVLLAFVSGSIASGLAYVAWYAALTRLSASRAAIVQLSVPVLAAVGGVLALDERITLQLTLSAAAILGGVALAVAARTPANPSPQRER